MERKNTYHKKLYILLNYAIDTIIKLCYYNINEENKRNKQPEPPEPLKPMRT